MRLPLDKPHRAFPELDRFSDKECLRFIAAARRHHRLFNLLIQALLIPAAALICPLAGVVQFGLTKLLGVGNTPADDLGSTLLSFLSIALGTTLPCLAWLLVRDRWLRRIIREQLRGASCYACSYSLLGLPIVDNVIICPECGQPFDLREADLVPEDLLAAPAAAAAAEGRH